MSAEITVQPNYSAIYNLADDYFYNQVVDAANGYTNPGEAITRKLAILGGQIQETFISFTEIYDELYKNFSIDQLTPEELEIYNQYQYSNHIDLAQLETSGTGNIYAHKEGLRAVYKCRIQNKFDFKPEQDIINFEVMMLSWLGGHFHGFNENYLSNMPPRIPLGILKRISILRCKSSGDEIHGYSNRWKVYTDYFTEQLMCYVAEFAVRSGHYGYQISNVYDIIKITSGADGLLLTIENLVQSSNKSPFDEFQLDRAHKFYNLCQKPRVIIKAELKGWRKFLKRLSEN